MKAETKVSKRPSRNWNDVQTAIATVSIVTTLGMWNVFATPTKKETVQTEQSISPTEQTPVETTPTPMPQVKIMFATQTVSQAVIPQLQQPQPTKKHKNNKNNNGNGSGGGGTVTTTKTS